MRRGSLAAALIALWPAPLVAGGPPPEPAQEAVIGRTWVHECHAGPRIVAEVAPEWVRLFLSDGPVRLPAAVSASGARYTDGTRTYWSKGRDAMIETGAARWTGCVGRKVSDPWQAARLRGVTLRAVGQEPGWLLEIGHGRLVALLDYGTRVLDLPAPAPAAGADGTVLSGDAAGHRVTVRLSDAACRDPMSGERFPATVAFTLDGETWHGCGMRLD